MDIRPSTYRRLASRRPSNEPPLSPYQLSAPQGDLRAGDPVCVYGANPEEVRLGSPPQPEIVVSGEGPSRRYAFRVLSSGRAWGPMSDPISVSPDENGLVKLEWPLDAFEPDARWLVAYRGQDSESLEPIDALICHPRGAGLFAHLRTVLVDDGGDEFRDRDLPAWFPDGTVGANPHGRLRTTIEKREGRIFTLADAMADGAEVDVDVLLAHDAGQAIAAALEAGEDVTLLHGTFQCHGDIEITHIQQELIGRKPRRGDLTLASATVLVFEDGDGMRLTGHNAVLERMTITQTPTRALPPLDLVLPARPREGDDDNLPGVAVMIEQRAHLKSVVISRCRGTGLAMIAMAGGIDSNANLSRLIDIETSAHLGHGVFVDGSDANAGVFESLNSVGNTGWGIVDEGLLGNLYSAPHTSENQLGPYRIGRVPDPDDPDELMNAATRSVLTNAYAEMGQGDSIFGSFVLVVGGVTGRWEGGGHVLGGDGFQRHIITGRDYRTTLGHHVEAHDTTLLRHDGPNVRHHRAVRADGAIDDYAFHSGIVSQRWHGHQVRGAGLIEFPRGALFGSTVIRSVDPARPPRGTYAPGDFCLNIKGGQPVTPAARFGIGESWTSKRIYRVGDVVAPGNDLAYVCIGVGRAYGGTSGDMEPNWAEAEVLDNEVTWERWGSDEPTWTEIGASS